MRPIHTIALLAATWLALLPITVQAQSGEEKPVAATEEGLSGVKILEAPKTLTKEEQADARRRAREERAQEEARQRAEREKLCIIKPVMTDAEIAFCKDVWR